MPTEKERSDLQRIIDKALREMTVDCGIPLDLDRINLAELGRKTGLSRSKLRTIKEHGFKVLPHGRTGQKAKVTVLTGYEANLDALLSAGVTNSDVLMREIVEKGYTGGLTSVKDYITAHKHLVPAKRKVVACAQQGNRGRRFRTAPGDSFQMDWGFVEVEDWQGRKYKIACFAMVCHHCGSCYVEFFPNARQENLLVGMVHAFLVMGVPKRVLTDHMKSVVLHLDAEGSPVWHPEYEAFMKCVGFETKLCKVRHPFTKGKVERLIQYVKRNMLAGKTFTDITQLNADAVAWCALQGGRYRRALDCVPDETHAEDCAPVCHEPEGDVEPYLCPRRRISFDGFVCYEGRRFGVPYWYQGKTCRVSREGALIHIYSEDLSRELVCHDVTWSRKDSFCEHQYADVEPEERPTAPVTTTIKQLEPPAGPEQAFAKFDFGGLS